MPKLGKLDYGALIAAIFSLAAAYVGELPEQIQEILILIAGGGLGAFGLLGRRGAEGVEQLKQEITSEEFLNGIAAKLAARVSSSSAILLLSLGGTLFAAGCGGAVAASPPAGYVSSSLQGEYAFADGEGDGELGGKIVGRVSSGIEFGDGDVQIPYELTVRADASVGDGAQFEVCFDSAAIVAIVTLFTGESIPDVLCASIPIGNRDATSSLSQDDADALAAAALDEVLAEPDGGCLRPLQSPTTATWSPGEDETTSLPLVGYRLASSHAVSDQLPRIPVDGQPAPTSAATEHEPLLAFANGCGTWSDVPEGTNDSDATDADEDADPDNAGTGDSGGDEGSAPGDNEQADDIDG